MFKVIHPNRWLFWTIGVSIIVEILLLWAIEKYSIEQEFIGPSIIGTFLKTGSGVEKSLIIVSPKLSEEINSPLQISGTARGAWFFEGEFSVFLKDADGNTLARASARSEKDWKTLAHVPFTAVLAFEKPSMSSGTLVFIQASGKNGESSEKLEIPVQFGPTWAYGWKGYLNDEFKFALEYPAWWGVSAIRTGSEPRIEFVGPSADDFYSTTFIISMSSNVEGKTLDQLAANSRWEKISEMIVGGTKAYQLILPETDAPAQFLLLGNNLVSSDYKFYLSLSRDSAVDEHILSTFNFIK